MDISKVTSVLACIVNFIGFVWYNAQIFKGKSKPNITTWFLLSAISTMASISFFIMTNDIYKSLPGLMALLQTIIILLFALKIGTYIKPKKFEIAIFVITIIIATIWAFSKNATIANLLLVCASIFSFYHLSKPCGKILPTNR